MWRWSVRVGTACSSLAALATGNQGGSVSIVIEDQYGRLRSAIYSDDAMQKIYDKGISITDLTTDLYLGHI